jgi:hypothetical protein
VMPIGTTVAAGASSTIQEKSMMLADRRLKLRIPHVR